MSFLLVAVLCSVLVSVHLKLARRLGVDVGQAIPWNYAVAAVLAAASLHVSSARVTR